MVGAAGLGAIGLLDDDRTVDPRFRFLAETVAAVLAVVVGLRIHATGIEALDILVTIIWIVGVTNAFNLLDNMDGLAAGVSAVAALSVFALAILRPPAGGGHPGRRPSPAPAWGSSSTTARRPRSSWATPAACSSASSSPSSPSTSARPSLPPVSFVIPLLLLAIPVLDTTVVTVARLRRGRPVSQGGRDHLSHRLAKRGLERRRPSSCSSAARPCSACWPCSPGAGSSR